MCLAARSIAKEVLSIAMPVSRALHWRIAKTALPAGDAMTQRNASVWSVGRRRHRTTYASIAVASVAYPHTTAKLVEHPILEKSHLHASPARQLLHCGAKGAIPSIYVRRAFAVLVRNMVAPAIIATAHLPHP